MIFISRRSKGPTLDQKFFAAKAETNLLKRREEVSEAENYDQFADKNIF